MEAKKRRDNSIHLNLNRIEQPKEKKPKKLLALRKNEVIEVIVNEKEIRQRVVDRLKQVLCKRTSESNDNIINEFMLESCEKELKIAEEIENEAFALHFATNLNIYQAKVRDLIANLQDKNNHLLLEKVRKGEILPKRLVSMDTDELATPEMKKLIQVQKETSIAASYINLPARIRTDEYICSQCNSCDTEYIDPGSRRIECTKSEVWGGVTTANFMLTIYCCKCGYSWKREI